MSERLSETEFKEKAEWTILALEASFAELAEERGVDPYDLVLVFAGPGVRPDVSAQPSVTPIKFAHAPHIANDGRIAFSYHEDIWVADADGSNARRLTAQVPRTHLQQCCWPLQ